MKYKITIIIGFLVMVLSLFFYLSRCYRKLPGVVNYSIISNTGMPIPAKLYSRMISNKKEIIKQYIICFNDTLVLNENTSGDEKLYKYLVIMPDLKIIGLINNMNSLKKKNKYLCQNNEDSNNFTFFSNPPIKQASFSNKKIVFNTYENMERVLLLKLIVFNFVFI